jgi:hypothetical protein
VRYFLRRARHSLVFFSGKQPTDKLALRSGPLGLPRNLHKIKPKTFYVQEKPPNSCGAANYVSNRKTQQQLGSLVGISWAANP